MHVQLATLACTCAWHQPGQSFCPNLQVACCEAAIANSQHADSTQLRKHGPIHGAAWGPF